MTPSRVLLLSVSEAEANNPKPCIVHFGPNLYEGLQVQEKDA